MKAKDIRQQNREQTDDRKKILIPSLFIKERLDERRERKLRDKQRSIEKKRNQESNEDVSSE